MANTLNGNTWYIDTAHSTSANDLVRASVLVTYIIVTATSASAVLVLSDVQGTAPAKLELRVAAADTSQLFDFSYKPLLFPNGIQVTTLTNCKAMCIISSTGG